MSLTTQEQAVFDQLAAKSATVIAEDVPLGLKEILTNIARTVGREHLIKHIENLVAPGEGTTKTPDLTPAPADNESNTANAGGK